MADVYAVLAAFLILAAGAGVIAMTIRAGRRKREQEKRSLPRRLRQELEETDAYLASVNEAASEDDLDALERE